MWSSLDWLFEGNVSDVPVKRSQDHKLRPKRPTKRKRTEVHRHIPRNYWCSTVNGSWSPSYFSSFVFIIYIGDPLTLELDFYLSSAGSGILIMKIKTKERKVIPDPIDDRKFQE